MYFCQWQEKTHLKNVKRALESKFKYLTKIIAETHVFDNYYQHFFVIKLFNDFLLYDVEEGLPSKLPI